MMPWSGLSQTSVKHAYEMGTSELHRTSIMLAAIALTTNRSKYPKDLSQRLCEKAGRTRRPKSTALADHSVCAKSLDRSGPVTEVLTLDEIKKMLDRRHVQCQQQDCKKIMKKIDKFDISKIFEMKSILSF